mmetsp:Transcript_14202/g.44714  ORF Transcript_14202/g.44714 Transcript_14202/m.44714 type:complete len:228 (-) Transcript_14202:251-934(-)
MRTRTASDGATAVATCANSLVEYWFGSAAMYRSPTAVFSTSACTCTSATSRESTTPVAPKLMPFLAESRAIDSRRRLVEAGCWPGSSGPRTIVGKMVVRSSPCSFAAAQAAFSPAVLPAEYREAGASFQSSSLHRCVGSVSHWLPQAAAIDEVKTIRLQVPVAAAALNRSFVRRSTSATCSSMVDELADEPEVSPSIGCATATRAVTPRRALVRSLTDALARSNDPR